MTKLQHFWLAVETIPGQEAVAAEWRWRLRGEWGWAAERLRPSGHLAGFYPDLAVDPDAGEPFRVVCHDEHDDDYVGVSPTGTEDLMLRRQDLVLYVLDRRALAVEIGASLGLVCDFGQVGELPYTYRIGVRNPAGEGEAWFYLVFPLDGDDLLSVLATLVLRHESPIVVLTPTRRDWRAWPESLRRRSIVLALGDVSSVDDEGRLVADRPVTALLRPAWGAGSAAECVFRARGRMWELGYGGETVYVPAAKGLSYIAYLLARPGEHTHVAEAMAAVAGDAGLAAAAGGVADVVFDRRAWAEARQAFAALRGEADGARARGDIAAEDRARREMAALAAQMNQAQGRGGSSRGLGVARERVRKAVGNVIERALAHLREEHEPLWRHLDASITRGTVLVYDPPTPVRWEL